MTGITASLVDSADWCGNLDVDYCLFEIDEAALPIVAKEVPISVVLVTNLFRDQLDRFGELDTTALLIGRGITCNKSKAVLNADDPNVAQLGADCERLFYGIESLSPDNSSGSPHASEAAETSSFKTVQSPDPATEASGTPEAGVQELAYCPTCSAEYVYSITFYGQLGHYACKSCGSQRPVPDISGSDVHLHPSSSTFALGYKGKSYAVSLPLPGLFNVYNALAAASLCFSLGLSADVICAGLTDYSTLFGRSERVTILERAVWIQLIKNPAGASQAVRAAVRDPHSRILIAINDNTADGRDVSWLWDAEFELLRAHDKPIIVTGQRCYDMALRLKYAAIPQGNITIIPELDRALQAGLDTMRSDETLWVLPTYTCLLDLQKITRSMGSTLSGT